MSYKYDPQNGYRNADQLNADIDEFNPSVVRAVNGAKKCEKNEPDSDKATRNFINNTALSIQEEKEESKQKKEDIKQEKKEIPSYYIAASIKDDMRKEEKNGNFER